jgi:hypothetical protein
LIRATRGFLKDSPSVPANRWSRRRRRRTRDVLELALRALDRADSSAAILARDGMTIVSARSGVCRVHPLLKAEQNERGMFLSWPAPTSNRSRPTTEECRHRLKGKADMSTTADLAAFAKAYPVRAEAKAPGWQTRRLPAVLG